ncbi:hypothetical protein KQX54_015501 [Cotesia glomerata]|uniref:Uncharacterized protein n=1 Tax=Cotesia glomerata TaxID=32391 RepID=A0AAV7IT78_COTGL|nr:hypothetical protein KQX54_015501 [Cotesia glomerata]
MLCRDGVGLGEESCGVVGTRTMRAESPKRGLASPPPTNKIPRESLSIEYNLEWIVGVCSELVLTRFSCLGFWHQQQGGANGFGVGTSTPPQIGLATAESNPEKAWENMGPVGPPSQGDSLSSRQPVVQLAFFN